MIIGAGGVATVAVHKCAQIPEVFTDILVASRTLSKCEAIQSDIKKRYNRDIQIEQVDADNVHGTCRPHQYISTRPCP